VRHCGGLFPPPSQAQLAALAWDKVEADDKLKDTMEGHRKQVSSGAGMHVLRVRKDYMLLHLGVAVLYCRLCSTTFV